MITDDYSLPEVLDHLDCSSCTYQEWVNVGMALHAEGYTVADWIRWSKTDAGRFHEGECEKKWASFRGDGVKAGTIIDLAIKKGWKPAQKRSSDDISVETLDWDSEIGDDGDSSQVPVKHRSLKKPGDDYSPGNNLIDFFEALYAPDDMLSLVPSRFNREKGKWEPDQFHAQSETRDTFIQKIKQADGDTEKAFPELQTGGGAWIIVNSTDGKGGKKENIEKWEYVLVENDSQSLEEQWGLLHKLHIPIRTVVYSGGKSLHAIVHVGAISELEYRERVQKLYDYCKENGYNLDAQNSNSNRLTRLPGFRRGDNWQYMLCGSLGPRSWDAWVRSLEDEKEGYCTVCFSDIMWNLPPRKPELIEGVLRETHKMLIAAPSKAGKSFLAIELAVCFAEGLPWLGHQCQQCTVLYANLEGDGDSFAHRIEDIYNAKGLDRSQRSSNLHVFNGRGLDMGNWPLRMSKTAHTLGAKVVILDPIYKLSEGDENNAQEVGKFCRELDKIAAAGVTVIYVHHFSKGAQGAKSSIDRSSGSGVHGRDVDANVSLIQLRVPEEEKMRFHCEYGETATLFRVEYTLREFPPHKDDYTVFSAPLHPVIEEEWVKSAILEETARGKEAKRSGTLSGEPEPDKTETLLQLMCDDLKREGETRQNNVYAALLGVNPRTITRYRKNIICQYGNLPGKPGYTGPVEQLSMDGQEDIDMKNCLVSSVYPEVDK